MLEREIIERVMNDLPATLLTHEDVRPQSFRGRRNSTRLQQYRRKMRKRRNRRIGFILLVTIAVVVSFVAYKMYHPEFTTQDFIPQETLNLERFDRMLQNAAEKMESSIQYVQVKINNILKRNDSQSVGHDHKKDDRKTRRSAPVVVVEEPQKVEETIPIKVPPPIPDPVPIIPVETTTMIAVINTVEERPGFCNIPLSYILNKKCWRLASKNPVFNLHELVQDMMQ